MKHLSATLSHRLHGLGAFDGRAWELGDLAYGELCADGEPSVVNRMHSYGGARKIGIMGDLAEYAPEELVLCPRIGDLLTELERRCSLGNDRRVPRLRGVYIPSDEQEYAFTCYECEIADAHIQPPGSEYEDPFWDEDTFTGTSDDDYATAAANCLCAVLEAEREGGES